MMSTYFAQIDDNLVCTYVAVTSQEFIDENPDRYPGTWVETFFDTPGKTYAGVGYLYDYATEDFTAPSYE